MRLLYRFLGVVSHLTVELAYGLWDKHIAKPPHPDGWYAEQARNARYREEPDPTGTTPADVERTITNLQRRRR